MTRSYGGGPDREPRGRNPRRDQDLHDKDQEPELRENGDGSQTWGDKLNSLSKYSDEEETAVTPVRIETGKRLVALIIDIFVANVIAVVVSFLPLVNIFLVHQLTMVLALLVRDFFFEGRGIGKNLMGLQVVDVKTGEPCSLIQSIKRNIIVLGPILIYLIVAMVLRLVPVPVVTETAIHVMNIIGTIYTLLVIPYEAYRVYNRADGIRFGDQFAGTAVVEAPMDFSTPIRRQ